VVGGDTAVIEDFSDHVWIIDPSAKVAGGLDLKRRQRVS
jgi:hypothetical protein